MRFKLQYAAFILLLPMAMGCQQQNNHAGELNKAAGLPEQLHFNQLGLKVITSTISKKEAAMSTLYGNDLALKYAKSKGDSTIGGMVFALVTWKQQDDERWFGAKIPGQFQSVETVTTKTNGNAVQTTYKIDKGEKLNIGFLNEKERIKYILAQKASVMP
ncbi:hypothetical protein [Pedobacter sp. WC2423]|uniref:hypothetical protein n=1 Tax=Pedobacter sp. WC2423 TaxID=3234142 RepID=UPI003464EF0F